MVTSKYLVKAIQLIKLFYYGNSLKNNFLKHTVKSHSYVETWTFGDSVFIVW